MPKISVLTPSIRGDLLHITQECLEQQTFQDFEFLCEIGLRNRGFRLPTDLNKMLRRAQGERIVMLQDCIKLESDALEKINELSNDFYTFPVGKVMEFGQSPEWDWREHKSWELDPARWEADFACAPRQAFFDIGGYDEDFNNGWSWDNVEVAYRAQKAGYRFFCHCEIKGVALDHDKMRENPFRGKLENNNKRAEATKYRAERGDFKLSYLQ